MQHPTGLMAAVLSTKTPELRGFCCAGREVTLLGRPSLLLPPGWCWVSQLVWSAHTPTTGLVVSMAAPERQKLSEIQAIKPSEPAGKGCLPPGGTSSRSSMQEGMSQETNWSYMFFLSWVVWL